MKKFLIMMGIVLLLSALVFSGCAKQAPAPTPTPAPAPAPAAPAPAPAPAPAVTPTPKPAPAPAPTTPTAPTTKALVLRYGGPAPPGQITYKAQEFLIKYITERSGGSIKIEFYPTMQLGSESVMFNMLLSGTLDMVASGAPIQSNLVPQMNILCMPFIFPDEDTFWSVARGNNEFYSKLAAFCREKGGYEMLGFNNGCGRGLVNKIRPIRTPDELKGLKIRVMEAPVYTDMWQAQGAITATIPFSELYTALQQGVVVGEDNSCDMALLMKFFEVEKYFTNLNQTIQANPTIVAKATWAKLSDDQKKLFLEAGKAMDAFSQQEYSKDKTAGFVAAKEKYGVQVIEKLTPEELALWRKNVEPMISKYAKIIGEEFTNYTLDLAKKATK